MDNETQASCEHCWHFTNVSYTTYPARQQQICCHCGTTQLYTPPKPEPPPGHGPHYPHPNQGVWPWLTGISTGTFIMNPAKTIDSTASCPCRQENGGSGICNCTLGGPKITYG